MKTTWKDGIKVYDEHNDGTPALWFDPVVLKIIDDQETIAVSDETEADLVAAEWLDAMASY